MNRIQTAQFIDHTLLKPDAVRVDIERLCEEAATHGFYSVCVQSGYVQVAKESLKSLGADGRVAIAAVCGFPHGMMLTSAKVAEAVGAVQAGATEIDMVLSIGLLKDGAYDKVEADIAAVVKAVQGQAGVKVIFETGYLNEQQIVEACKRSVAAGAAFVKTSTGFGPGGATIEHIQLMRNTVGQACGVKASGGVRDMATMRAMITAGANRIGTSSGIAILNGAMADTGAY
jgi:deoxyribose-phosphate aldolase